MITKGPRFEKIKKVVDGIASLSLLLLFVTGKSNAISSSLGLGPTNFTMYDEKVQLFLGKASLLLKGRKSFLTYISEILDSFML